MYYNEINNAKCSLDKMKINYLIFRVREKGLEIELKTKSRPNYIAIPTDVITDITIENTNHIQVGEQKSVIGRSVAGAILLGPLGAVIGGMSGLSQGGLKNAGIEQILSINFTSLEEKESLHFSINKSANKKVPMFFNKYYKDKFAVIDNETRNEKPAELIDVADELKKFADLKEQGILTEEEFIQKKKQILGL
jgi:hypothetical protein